MNKKILNIAIKKFNILKRVYPDFIFVGVDNWRGYRYIFDTSDVRSCTNDCLNCKLYQLVKNEKEKEFSATLKLASTTDRKIFGSQQFLNCKTLNQYRDCYIRFIIYKTQTYQEIFNELCLVKGFRLIYSKEGDARMLERNFKRSVVQQSMNRSKGIKRKLIRIIAKQLQLIT